MVRRRLLLGAILAGGLPGGVVAQECAVALGGGGAFSVADNVGGPVPRAGFVGLDFGCRIGPLRVGVILDQHGRSQEGAWFFNDVVAIDGLLGRVAQEFALGAGPRASWVEVAALAGPTWTEFTFQEPLAWHSPPQSHYKNPGVGAGAAVRFGLRPVRALSLFLESGVRYNRVGVRSTRDNISADKAEWTMAIPLGVGVRWSF